MTILPSWSLLLGESHFVLIQVSVWFNKISCSPSPFWGFLCNLLEIPQIPLASTPKPGVETLVLKEALQWNLNLSDAEKWASWWS